MKKARGNLIVDDIYALGLMCILSISTDGVKGKLKISHEKKTIITVFGHASRQLHVKILEKWLKGSGGAGLVSIYGHLVDG
jgi:hypothetical protein